MIYIEIKFKNGSKIESIESEDSKRSSSMRIKFELMEHDLHLHWYQELWLKF